MRPFIDICTALQSVPDEDTRPSLQPNEGKQLSFSFLSNKLIFNRIFEEQI